MVRERAALTLRAARPGDQKTKEKTRTKHFTCGHEVARHADDRVSHVRPKREGTCGNVHDGREGNRRSDDLLDGPFAAKLADANPVVCAQGRVPIVWCRCRERVDDAWRKELCATQRGVDAFTRERVEKVSRITHERGSGRPRPARGRRERAGCQNRCYTDRLFKAWRHVWSAPDPGIDESGRISRG